MFRHCHDPVEHTNAFGETVIDSFRNEYDFLSNFHLGSLVTLWGVNFSTSEHAFQWAKTHDPKEKETVLFTLHQYNDHDAVAIPTTPGQAKRAGAEVTKRPDWDEVVLDIMYEVLMAKFTQNWDLRQKLLDTGEALLIEGNTWCDNFWGECKCPKCEKKEKHNYLGKLLMRLRTELGHASKIYCHGCPVA